jgi:hypothetical protein
MTIRPALNPINLMTWEIKSNKFEFQVTCYKTGRTAEMEKKIPVIDKIFRTTAAAGAGLKRSLGIRGECFLAIHTLLVLISRFDRIFRK